MPQAGKETTGKDAPVKRATWIHVARVVVSGLFMLGQNKDFDKGAPVIGPARLIIGAVIGFALLIGGLILLVSMITK